MHKPLLVIAACAALAACSEMSDPAASVVDPQFAKPPAGPSDPTASWLIPLDGTGLAFTSDGKYAAGPYSVYQNGVCGVTAKIFATASASNSGDATMQTDNPANRDRKCADWPRKVTFTYPDAVSETTTFFGNLHEIQNTTYSIPIGATVTRPLNLSSSSTPSRCGTIRFRTTKIDGTYLGADSVLVTRLDASTWEVTTQPAPNNRGYCENLGSNIEMPLRFRVVSATPLQ